MHTRSNSVKGHRQVFSRVRVFRAYAVCRDTLQLTPGQTWRLLKGAARGRDIADAEQLYNERSS